MDQLNGNVISGDYDYEGKEFTVQQIKNYSTLTLLTENQLDQLTHYLQQHQNDEDGQIVTLNDQMPVKLSKEELQLLISDLEYIKTFF